MNLKNKIKEDIINHLIQEIKNKPTRTIEYM